MFKVIAKIVCLGALFAAVSSTAKADPITGAISIVGADTFNGNGVTFATPNPITGTNGSVLASTISTNGFGYTGFGAVLNSFSLNPFTPSTTPLFSVDNLISTLKFTIGSITGVSCSNSAGQMISCATAGGAGTSMNIFGNGTFSEAFDNALFALNPAYKNFTNTTGTFSLTTSNNVLTSFQLVSSVAATPEPNSLMLLGTGLVSAAGMLVRRRRASAIA